MTIKSITRCALGLITLLAAATSCGVRYDVPQKVEWQHITDASLENGVITLRPGSEVLSADSYTDFILTGQAYTEADASASLWFHVGDNSGYEVLFQNGPMDGRRMTGSLATVRNLYKSMASDTTWFDFEIAVRSRNIAIAINGIDVVCYTEPEHPYRTEENSGRILSSGRFALRGDKGKVIFRDLTVTPLHPGTVNPADTLPPVDETTDQVIRLQQRNFPVIDYHVHLKGGLTKEMAHAMSMNYGINYGVAPNVGEGGVGRMLADDAEAIEYFKEVSTHPFLMGAQGEGRRWIVQFSPEVLDQFDYFFTDAMTVVDRGRISRIYRPEEVYWDERNKQQYMDMIVDQTVKILTNEPADIYANATYIPEDSMNDDYAIYWTDERVDKVLDVLEKYGIALEISPRYKIPSIDVIRKAKERGLKFTFGTNNVDPDFGRCEYAIQAVEECGLTPEDIWFPSMGTRKGRKAVDYNHFGEKK
ncbi:MAG: DUF1080 domain-containing protein [Muribaculaceae bacterium]|nr:DUF1080 domain-containing protein [Muribaculaceae bacterium]